MKANLAPLVFVAILALGALLFVGESGLTGNVQGGGPIQPTGYQPETTGSDVAQVQLQCYIWKYDHPNVQAPVEIAGLCASFGVTV